MAFEHTLVKEGMIEERAYQINIARAAQYSSTLVVLPTGMGKTIIAFMVMAERKKRYPDRKILFMAPTKPLVHQHARDIEDMLKIGSPTVFTGEVSPEKRMKLWKDNDVIVSTPQVIRNDVMAGRIDLEEVSLVIFDEAHRATGGYAYCYIGEKYKDTGGLALGLTASPGSDIERIREVCEVLGFENVEIRTKYDPDVINYIKKRDIQWIEVELTPKQKRVVKLLKKVLEKHVKKLQHHGFLTGRNPKAVSRKKILEANRRIQAQIHGGGKNSLFNAASLCAGCLKLDHAIDQAETQGPDALRDFLEKLKNEAEAKGGTRAASRIMNAPEIKEVMMILASLKEEHPKVQKTVDVVKEQIERDGDSRIIVFTSYRFSAKKLNRRLASKPGLLPVRFVGQSDKEGDKGLKQAEQVQAINDFEDGKYNVLVATSIGEEGLDIPSTDLVVFYEPVASEIRTIQRRGRTARKREGKVIVLITKGTRDEGYYWASKNREKKMIRNLYSLKEGLKDNFKVDSSMDGMQMPDKDKYDVVKKKSKKDLKKRADGPDKKKTKGQRSLIEFDEVVGNDKKEAHEITVDVREQNSDVVRELSKKDLNINVTRLSTGDYIVSQDVAVERKSVEDFLESLIDGRLFAQARSLSKEYIHPVIIIEGEGLYRKRNIDDRAIYGALISLATDFKIPILPSADGKETAGLIHAMIKRKDKKKKSGRRRPDKSTLSDRDSKLFIIEGLPNVSGTLAQRLLEHFGSVRAVFEADLEELQEVEGIGPSTAKKIIEILE